MRDLYNYQGKRLNVAVKDELLFSDLIYTVSRNTFWGGYRFNGITYDTKNNCFYMIGGSTDRDGTSKLIKFTDIYDPLNDSTIVTLQTGHSNDITYDPVNDLILVAGGISSNDGATENQYSYTLFLIDPSTLSVRSTKTFQNVVQGVEATEDGVYIFFVNSGTYDIKYYDSDLVNVKNSGTLTKDSLVNFLHGKIAGALYSQNISFDAEEKRLYWNISSRDDYLTNFRNFQNALMVEIDISDFSMVRSISFDVSTSEEFQGSLFTNGFLYLVSDGKYGTFRAFNSKIQRANNRKWIAPNTDLDKILSTGEYFSNDATNSGTLLNCPITTEGFTMNVYVQGAYGRRQYMISESGASFQRFYNVDLNTWTAWD